MTHPLLNFLDLWKSNLYEKAIKDLIFGPVTNLDPTDEVAREWNKIKSGPTIQLSSSGSASKSRFYSFGPIDGIFEVERLIKKSPLAMIHMHLIDSNGFYPIKNRIYSKLFAFSPKINDFSKLWEWTEKTSGILCAAPNVWLFLSKQENFLKELESSGVKSISTTGWEPFFNKKAYPVLVNDNMLNVKTGDGFYTCDFNKVHCLPFKLKFDNGVANLLNMADKTTYNDDDEITWEYEICECWSRLPICKERICHNTNTFRPKLEIANFLEGQYKNWQAIKTEECINLFLSGKYDRNDVDKIQEHLGDCRIWNGLRYRTGINKWASFWSTEEIDETKIEIF